MNDYRGLSDLLIRKNIFVQKSRQEVVNRQTHADATGESAKASTVAQALEWVSKAKIVLSEWDPNQNVNAPKPNDLLSSPELEAKFQHDMQTLSEGLSHLTPLMDHPAMASGLADTQQLYQENILPMAHQYAQFASAEVLSDSGAHTASLLSTPYNPANNPDVWSTVNLYNNMPEVLTSQNILAHIFNIFLGLNVAIQGVLGLQDRQLSALKDNIDYLNKVQAAYTEIAEYFANGGSATALNPDPADGSNSTAYMSNASLEQYLPNLYSLLKSTLVNGQPYNNDGQPSYGMAGFALWLSKINETARQNAGVIDAKYNNNDDPADDLFPSKNIGSFIFFGTPDYFTVPVAGHPQSGAVSILNAGDANDSIKRLSTITSAGSSISQKSTALIQSTQTNYNNLWGFIASFIKDLNTSLQIISQA